MEIMGLSRHARRLAAGLGLTAALTAFGILPRAAHAQDRAVGREALDPADQENLPPSVDGRTDSPEEVDPRALEEFREPLEAHGRWVEDSEYGTVWVPDAREVGTDFTPYSTGGHWELTSDADWLWVSDYSWGDIPFHYGRWVWISGRGWAWIPGRVWAPAWVVWRTGPYGYVGWAPCPPTWTWWYGSATWLYWPPPAAYLFVETRYVFDRHVHHHVIRTPARVRHAATQTRPQRQPARPGARSQDRFRPASPDLESIRYAGPPPSRSPMRTHPEVGRDMRARDGRSPASTGSRTLRGQGDGTRDRGVRAEGRDRGVRPRADGRDLPSVGRPDPDRTWDGRRPPVGDRGRGPGADPRGFDGRGPDPRGPDSGRPDVGRPPAGRPDAPRAPVSRPDVGRPGPGPARDVSPAPAPPRDGGPSRDPGPSFDARPDRSGPSSPSGGMSRPSIRPSAPSVAPPRPSIRPSAPAGGGMRRGGGGGRGR